MDSIFIIILIGMSSKDFEDPVIKAVLEIEEGRERRLSPIRHQVSER